MHQSIPRGAKIPKYRHYVSEGPSTQLWPFLQIGGFVVGVLTIRFLLFGVHDRAPGPWKLPHKGTWSEVLYRQWLLGRLLGPYTSIFGDLDPLCSLPGCGSRPEGALNSL